MLTTTQETPANYIAYAGATVKTARDITPLQFRKHLKSLLENPSENAGEIFAAFLAATKLNQKLTSTFYPVVNDAFEELRHGTGDQPQRWNDLMSAIADASATDPVLLKYVRNNLLGKSIPALLGSQSSSCDKQVASDVLTVADAAPHLSDAIKSEWVRSVVMWHFTAANHNFLMASKRFATLRESAAFASAVTAVENKYGVHVDSIPLDHDTRKTLVVAFKRADHAESISVIDLSKPGRANHPRDIEIDGPATPYRDQITDILLRSSDLPEQNWVEPIATDAYCRLG